MEEHPGLFTRLRSKITHGRFSRFIHRTLHEPRGPTVFTVRALGKTHYFALLGCTGIMMVNFYSSMLVTKTRKETFGRNYAIIEKHFATLHTEALGPDAKINKLGYPDMGNNLYSQKLPYQDWVKINNAQRQHEVGLQHGVVLFANAFITALNFPRFTSVLIWSYFFLRVSHINSWMSFRGHNKAWANEETLRFIVVLSMIGAMRSSAHLAGYTLRPAGAYFRSTRLG